MSYLDFTGQALPETTPPSQWIPRDPNRIGPYRWDPAPAGGATLDDGRVVNGSDFDTLVGGAGGDWFYVTERHQVIEESSSYSSIDTVTTFNTYKLPDNVENLYVASTAVGIGNSADNLIFAHHDAVSVTLDGGAGDDVLVDTSQATAHVTFSFQAGQGNDVVYNFDPSRDFVKLNGGGLESFQQIQTAMTQTSEGVVLHNGGSDVLFRGLQISQFTADNFGMTQLSQIKQGQTSFSEEFNDPNWHVRNPYQADPANATASPWRADYGYEGQDGVTSYSLTPNNEKQVYVSSYYRENNPDVAALNLDLNPFSVANSHLTITASPTPQVASTTDPFHFEKGGQSYDYDYMSGLITTHGTFSQQYGYFEMKAQTPQGDGTWPAFWLLPEWSDTTPRVWPPELDVMEGKGGSYTFVATSHWGQPDQDHAAPSPEIYAGAPDAEHTYGLLWLPEKLVWFVDGAEVYEHATDPTQDKPMYMLVNLALGPYAGPVDPNSLPETMTVDYVKAWAYDPSWDAMFGATGGGDDGGGGGEGQVVPEPTSYPATLTGGAGADTINGGQGPETIVTGAGSDLIVFAHEPYDISNITDFTVGTDHIDLSALFQAAGYSGADPVADGYIQLINDGTGHTAIRFDHDGPGPSPQFANTIIDLSGLTFGTATWAQISAGGSSGGGGSGGTVVPEPTSYPATLTGGAGSDTINGGVGPETIVTGAGADLVVFAHEPYDISNITDFAVGTDHIDLSALFQAAGYSGTDPVADGYIQLINDGTGHTAIRFDHDGPGPSPQFANTIIDLSGVTFGSATWAQISASGSSGGGGSGGVVVPAPSSYPATLTGGAGSDTINGGVGPETIITGGGADVVIFHNEPYDISNITDFTVGSDHIDLSPLLDTAGYTGSNPIADGYVYALDDGAGGTLIRYDRDGTGGNPQWPATIIDLQGVPVASLQGQSWLIF